MTFIKIHNFELFFDSDPFLRCQKSLSYSRISPNFMKPEDPLPCSQKPATGPYPEPADLVHTTPSYFL
jgi:hypothetical protein